MEFVILIVLLFIMIEEIFAFVLYPFKTGKVYYKLIKDNLIFKFDPIVGYVLTPNLVYKKPTVPPPLAPRKIQNVDIRTNKDGFLFTEDVAFLKEKLIFCIGGSITAGFESRYNKTYPAVLDSLVRRHGGYRCINAGVGGYRSIHELLLFKKKILPYKPSMVIIYSGCNDFEDFAYNYYKPYNQFSHVLSHHLSANRFQQILFYSAFLHVLKRLMFKLSGNIRTESIPDSIRENLRVALTNNIWLNEWRNNIGNILELCKINNIKCYLLKNIFPTYENASKEAKDFSDIDLNMYGRFDIFVDYIKIINGAIVGLCNKNGAKCIDVTSFFPLSNYKERFSLFVDRMHLSEEGNALLARSIYETIKGDL